MKEEHNTTGRNEILLIAMINEIIEVAGVRLLEEPESLNWECCVWGHQCKFNYLLQPTAQEINYEQSETRVQYTGRTYYRCDLTLVKSAEGS